MKQKIKLFERRRCNNLSFRCGVYAIYIHTHIYVGSSENLSRRLTEHRMDIPKKGRGCRILHNLYECNSKEDFYYEILEYCPPKDRLLREKYYISLLKADCNTAEDPLFPVTHCQKVYQYSIDGEYINEYESLSEAARKVKGREGNISIAINKRRYAYNSLWSFRKEEHYPHTPSTKKKTKNIYMFSSTTLIFIRRFISISDAARFLMSLHNEYKSFDSLCNTIGHCCSKQLIRNFHGYTFSFRETIYIPKETNNGN